MTRASETYLLTRGRSAFSLPDDLTIVVSGGEEYQPDEASASIVAFRCTGWWRILGMADGYADGNSLLANGVYEDVVKVGAE